MDWEEREAKVYLNGFESKKTGLYHFGKESNDVDFMVDAVKIYNLNPNTTSFWKNIEVC